MGDASKRRGENGLCASFANLGHDGAQAAKYIVVMNGRIQRFRNKGRDKVAAIDSFRVK